MILKSSVRTATHTFSEILTQTGYSSSTQTAWKNLDNEYRLSINIKRSLYSRDLNLMNMDECGRQWRAHKPKYKIWIICVFKVLMKYQPSLQTNQKYQSSFTAKVSTAGSNPGAALMWACKRQLHHKSYSLCWNPPALPFEPKAVEITSHMLLSYRSTKILQYYVSTIQRNYGHTSLTTPVQETAVSIFAINMLANANVETGMPCFPNLLIMSHGQFGGLNILVTLLTRH